MAPRQYVHRAGRRTHQLFARYLRRRVFGVYGRHDRQSHHALVRDRDVAAAVLLPACAGGGYSVGHEPRGDVLHDCRDHVVHRLGWICARDPWDGGRSTLGAFRRGGPRAWWLAHPDSWPPRDSLVVGFAAINASLSIPGYILGESALSLLGLGIQEPAASWGNLLSQAMDPQNIEHYPWVSDSWNFHFRRGDGLQFSRRLYERPTRPRRPALDLR